MNEQKKDRYSIGSLLRERGKKPTQDIAEVWSKAGVKRLVSSPRKVILHDIKLRNNLKRANSSKNAKIKSNSSTRRLLTFIVNKKLLFTVILFSIGVFVVGFRVKLTDKKEYIAEPNKLLGVSSNNVNVQEGVDVPEPIITSALDTEFSLIWPGGASASDYEIAKVSPPNNDPVYAYIDIFQGAELRISQQAIPESFTGNIATKVQEIATSFQATDVIQINDMKIYHGFSDKQGKVQSLIFEKDNLLVFIASPVKFSDDVWAGYIIGLHKDI